MEDNSQNPFWHDVAAVTDLDPDFPTGIAIGQTQVGIFLQDEQVFAIENVCPHAFALLSEGFQENGVIECPLHGAQFEIATGKCLSEIGQRDLKTFPVKVENGRVCIHIRPTT